MAPSGNKKEDTTSKKTTLGMMLMSETTVH